MVISCPPPASKTFVTQPGDSHLATAGDAGGSPTNSTITLMCANARQVKSKCTSVTAPAVTVTLAWRKGAQFLGMLASQIRYVPAGRDHWVVPPSTE